MTKKDYEVIAEGFCITMGYLNTYQPYAISLTPKAAVQDTASNVADELERRDPRFKRKEFLQLCGTKD